MRVSTKSTINTHTKIEGKYVRRTPWGRLAAAAVMLTATCFSAFGQGRTGLHDNSDCEWEFLFGIPAEPFGPIGPMSFGMPPGDPNPIGPKKCDEIEGPRTGCMFTFSHRFRQVEWRVIDCGRGRPLRLDPRAGFGPPDFPPRETAWAASSLPLVSKEAAHQRGPTPFAKRPSLNGVLDLMTGRPMIQEVDFELPFGSAVFRHVRTYSEDFSAPVTAGATGLVEDYERLYGRWAWNGARWMMSENPILLFSADYWWNADDSDELRPRTCHLILDAHHSIPFDQDETTGRFFAPPWFDAAMEHDGTWDAGQRLWSQWPERIVVWLQRGGLRYEFQVIFDDVFAEAHESTDSLGGLSIRFAPDEPGYGVPHYALLLEISDRFGNRIENHYCETRRWGGFPPDPNDCRPCAENCAEKGQLSAVTLRGASGQVAWTLLYTYRSFEIPCVDQLIYTEENPRCLYEHETGSTMPAPNLLHSIHVYEGALPEAELTRCRVLSGDEFCCSDLLDEPLKDPPDPNLLPPDVDPMCRAVLSAEDRIVFAELLEGWVIEARYAYDNFVGGDALAEGVSVYRCPIDMACRYPLSAVVEGAGAPVRYGGAYGGNLYKVTVTRKTSAEEDDASITHRLYRYRADRAGGPAHLWANFDEGAVSNILKAAAQSGLPWNVNDLVLISSDAPVPAFDPETDEIEYVSLLSMANLVMYEYQHNATEATSYMLSLVEQYARNSPQHVVSKSEAGRQVIEDRRSEAQTPGQFVTTWFQVHPPDSLAAGTQSPEAEWKPLERWPYRYLTQRGPVLEFGTADLSEVRFVAIIEEFDPDPRWPTYSTATGEYQFDPETGGYPGLVSRRMVAMNAAGFVLSERHWSYEHDAEGQLIYSSGARDTFEYDCFGRVTKRFTAGFNAADPGAQENEGLIYSYAYDEDECQPCPPVRPCERRGELKHVAVQKGTEGTPYLLERYERGNSDRPELVTRVERFSTPVTAGGAGAGDSWTVNEYVLEAPDHIANPKPFEKRVRQKSTIRSAGPLSENASNAYAVSRTRYNRQGNEAWTGAGTTADPAGETLLWFYAARQDYDPQRKWQRIASILDVDDPNAPAGFERVATDLSVAEPLNETTTFEYHDYFGLSKITYPNGRETHIAYVFDHNDVVMQFTYKDVYYDGGGARTQTPVEHNVFEGGRLTETRLLTAVDPEAPLLLNGHDVFEVLSVTTPKYDQSGRLAGVSRTGDGATISAYVFSNGFGQPAKQVDPDGTITRHQYDGQGRLLRTFRGTIEGHPQWGYAPPDNCDEYQEPTLLEFEDNLVLVERRYYGEDVTDANLLVAIRNYQEHSASQYPRYYAEPNVNNCFIDIDYETDDDQRGWATILRYDWRMRHVWTEQVGVTGLPLRHTLTWYDNLDRVRFTAEFGATPPSGYPDPRALSPGDDVPSAAAILELQDPGDPGDPGTDVTLLSLTESIYNPAGLVQETRTYDVSDLSGGGYTSTRTYYDHAGRPIEVHSPGSAVQQYVYDAKGRQVVSRSLAGGVEVSRGETEYDANDRAIASRHLERIAGGGGAALDGSNAVITYTHTWYDLAGRVLATANYGTASGDDTFTNAAQAPERPANPPTAGAGLGLVTRYEYDEAGRQSAVFHPDGTVTRYEYDALGRQTAVVENADDAEPSLRRRTEYVFHETTGQLVRMVAVMADGQTPDQVTEFVYDAAVVDESGVEISRSKALIAAVHYPDPATGEPSVLPDLTFTYYADGSVASRTDARGVALRYFYDELGRRTQTLVDDSAWYAGPGGSGLLPGPRISRIEHEYAPDGRLTDTWAYGLDSGGEVLLSHNQYEYDDRWNLRTEWQSLGEAVGAGSPRVDYEWDYSPAGGGNYNRLTEIVYPPRSADGSRRAIVFEHGAGGGGDAAIDAQLGRVTGIVDLSSGASAAYAYGGLSRRAVLAYGNGVCANLADPGGSCGVSALGYAGLDRFGRVRDLHYRHSGATTVHRYEYGYDAAGNRLHARVTQWPTVDDPLDPPVPHENDRSWLYGYDALQRLITADLGRLNATNDGLLTGVGDPVPRSSSWNLDILGNWAGGPGAPGVLPGLLETGDLNLDGLADADRSVTHAVDARNEIAGVIEGDDPEAIVAYVYDSGGNLTFDGGFWWQYDAWNRLLEVRAAGTLTAEDFIGYGPQRGEPAAGLRGQLDPERDPEHQPGEIIIRLSYDGLGRLVLLERRLPDGQFEEDWTTERYLYDGVRRIQTRVHMPEPTGGLLVAGDETMGSAGVSPAVASDLRVRRRDGALADPNSDPNFAHLPIRDFLTRMLEELWGLHDPNAPRGANDRSLPVAARLGALPRDRDGTLDGGTRSVTPGWSDIEYVYGPEYVDEHAFLIDADEQVFYALPDANYNVMGWTDATGEVVSQYVYSPYGQPLLAERLSPYAPSHVPGHQGLFFVALADITGATWEIGEADLSPAAVGYYYNRNRILLPHLGRFAQRDMNETALVVLALAMNAQTIDALAGAFDAAAHFTDGMNLFLYGRGNPISGADPTGLNWWDDDIDDLIADMAGQRAGNAAAVMDGLGLAFDVTGAIVKTLWSLTVLSSAVDLAVAIGSGDMGAVAMAGFDLLGGKMIKAIGHASSTLRRVRKCSCFAAGTMVDTPDGPVEIERIDVGDVVLSRHEDDPGGPVIPRSVTRVFRDVAPAVLWITLDSGESFGVTPDHEVWTLEVGWTTAGRIAVGDRLRDTGSGAVAVVDVAIDDSPSTVFNFEVDGTFTYFVEGVWVHNNSCPAILPLDRVHGSRLHNAAIDGRIRDIKNSGGREIRKNQALVNNNKQKVSNLRPDIQYIGNDNKVYLEEIVYSNPPSKNRRDDFIKALGKAFGGYKVHEVPR